MYFQQIIKNYILKFFVFFLMIYFFDIFSFLSTTAYCVPSDDPDRLNISIPGPVMRVIKQVGTDIAWAGKDLGIVGTAAFATRSLPAMSRAGAIVGLYASTKFAETAIHCIKNHEKSKTLIKSASNDTKIPSVIEPYTDWLTNIFENLSDVQTIAACSAGLISVCIMLFTFLTLWVIGREYVEKAKSIMANYPFLNKIFLFYLKWGDLASVPARIFFVCFIYLNLSLSIYFLTYIPLFLQQK